MLNDSVSVRLSAQVPENIGPIEVNHYYYYYMYVNGQWSMTKQLEKNIEATQIRVFLRKSMVLSKCFFK